MGTKTSLIMGAPLEMLWLLHSGPPAMVTLDPRHREPLLQKFRQNFFSSVTAHSPLVGSGALAEAIDEDPHLAPFKTAKLLDPTLVFPCSDGIVVVGGLQAGLCPDHDHPLVGWSITSLPVNGMPEELAEPWEAVHNPTLTIAQCSQTFQHMAVVFQGFFLQVVNQGSNTIDIGRWGFGPSN